MVAMALPPETVTREQLIFVLPVPPEKSKLSGA